jgi:glutaredoxin
MRAEIWTKENCPYCVRAKALFNQKGVEYEEKIIGRDTTREQLLERVPHAKTVPQIWLDGEYIGGYTELVSFYDKSMDSI